MKISKAIIYLEEKYGIEFKKLRLDSYEFKYENNESLKIIKDFYDFMDISEENYYLSGIVIMEYNTLSIDFPKNITYFVNHLIELEKKNMKRNVK